MITNHGLTFTAAADGVVAEPEGQVQEHRDKVGGPVDSSLREKLSSDILP